MDGTADGCARATILPTLGGVAMLRRYDDWTIHLDVDAVIRGQGMEPAAVRDRSPRIVAAAEKAIEASRGFIEPLVLTREFAISAHRSEGLVLEGGELPCGPAIAARLAPAHRLIVVAATVGEAIDDYAVDSFAGDPMFALGVHGVGSAAVEDLAMQACRTLRREADGSSPGCSILCWPGSRDWPNDAAQEQIFALLDMGEEYAGVIGLTPSRLIRPAKSLSFVVGITSGPHTDDEACETCGLIPVCTYRGC
jgi:hypothetical protein